MPRLRYIALAPPDPLVARLIELALEEDLGPGDLTTRVTVPATQTGRSILLAKEDLVVSGLAVAAWTFGRLDPACRFTPLVKDGQKVRRGKQLARVIGPLRALLSGERTALNFLRHLSGIATLTRTYAAALKDSGCTLLDTRKTTPGMRSLEKAAVRHGGGRNHRLGLFDGVMIKDNHIAASGSLAKAVHRTRQEIPPTVRIEVECESLLQVRQALAAGADIIMLDNMDLGRMLRAVALIAGRARTEASGNVTLERLPAIAATGVDFVSCGAITHAARQVDISMELLPR